MTSFDFLFLVAVDNSLVALLFDDTVLLFFDTGPCCEVSVLRLPDVGVEREGVAEANRGVAAEGVEFRAEADEGSNE
jgi:hypothetical protein